MHPTENARLWKFERELLKMIETNNIDVNFQLFVKRQKKFGIPLINGFDKIISQFILNEVSVIGFYKNLDFYFGGNGEGTNSFQDHIHRINDLKIQIWYFAAYPEVIIWFKKQELENTNIYIAIIEYLKNNNAYFPNRDYPFDDFSINVIVNSYLDETEKRLEVSTWNFDYNDNSNIDSIKTKKKGTEIQKTKNEKRMFAKYRKVFVLVVVFVILCIGLYWIFTRPNGSQCDCDVQSYYEANEEYCHDLEMKEPVPQSYEELYSKRGSCITDFKTEVDEKYGYTKFDAIIWYNEKGLPTYRPVVLKDDGKYPENIHADQIKKALSTGNSTKIE